MKINLTLSASLFLFKMFYDVDALDKDARGMFKVEPYQAKDEIATEQVAEISRWMQANMITQVDGKINVSEVKDKEIEKHSVKRLQEICSHYETIGRVINNIQSYQELLDALKNAS